MIDKMSVILLHVGFRKAARSFLQQRLFLEIPSFNYLSHHFTERPVRELQKDPEKKVPRLYSLGRAQGNKGL